jgi:hypothetical protein
MSESVGDSEPETNCFTNGEKRREEKRREEKRREEKRKGEDGIYYIYRHHKM